jgi:hypothetical protein
MARLALASPAHPAVPVAARRQARPMPFALPSQAASAADGARSARPAPRVLSAPRFGGSAGFCVRPAAAHAHCETARTEEEVPHHGS